MRTIRMKEIVCLAMAAAMLFMFAGAVYGADNEDYNDALRILDAYTAKELNKFAPQAHLWVRQGVQLIGTVGKVDKTDDVSTYVLHGYSGATIEVDTSRTNPLVNDDLYIVGTVRRRGDTTPYIIEEKRFKTDRDSITAQIGQSELYALSCCFRKFICNSMEPIDRANWLEGARTKPSDIKAWFGISPEPVKKASDDTGSDDRDIDHEAIAWYYWAGGAAIVILLVLVVVGILMVATKGGGHRTGQSSHHGDGTGAERSGSMPDGGQSDGGASNPPRWAQDPLIEPGTVVRSRGAEVQVSDEATIVRGPAHLEVSSGGGKTGTTINLLRPSTLMGRGRRKDTNFPDIPSKNFIKLDMSDRPAEDRKFCSREYCLFKLEDGKEYTIENITEGDNWLLVNGDQIHKGDSRTLQDGDKIKLDPDWEFVYHKTN